MVAIFEFLPLLGLILENSVENNQNIICLFIDFGLDFDSVFRNFGVDVEPNFFGDPPNLFNNCSVPGSLRFLAQSIPHSEIVLDCFGIVLRVLFWEHLGS